MGYKNGRIPTIWEIFYAIKFLCSLPQITIIFLLSVLIGAVTFLSLLDISLSQRIESDLVFYGLSPPVYPSRMYHFIHESAGLRRNYSAGEGNR